MNTTEDRIATWCGLILAGGALALIPLWIGFNGLIGLFELAIGGACMAYGCLRLGRIAGVGPRRRRRSKAPQP